MADPSEEVLLILARFACFQPVVPLIESAFSCNTFCLDALPVNDVMSLVTDRSHAIIMLSIRTTW